MTYEEFTAILNAVFAAEPEHTKRLLAQIIAVADPLIREGVAKELQPHFDELNATLRETLSQAITRKEQLTAREKALNEQLVAVLFAQAFNRGKA